jgi:ribose transport system permease protein
VNRSDIKSLPNEKQPSRRPWRPADLLSYAGPYLGLILVIGLFSVLILASGGRAKLDLFLSLNNLKLVTVHAAIPAAVALGMTVIMISGGIDLSVGYVVSLVTVTTLLTYNWIARQPALASLASVGAIAAGLGTGLLCGCANGVLITRLKVVPFVVTLGMMGVARGLAQYLTKGMPVPFPNPAQPPAWVPWLGAIEPEPAWLVVGPAVWSVLLFALGVAILLRYSIFGRYCYALGSNEATARLCGIHVERTKVILYTLAGLLTGWGGILQVARSGSGRHDVQAGLELDVIAAVVIGGGSLSGGEGTILGTLVGALMITVLGNGCSKLDLPVEFRFIIIGMIIVVVSAVNMWRQRRQRSSSPTVG